MIKRIIYNSSVQIFGKAVSLTLSIIVTSILARQLGATSYGQYALILALVNFLVAVANWGTQIIGVRELARAKNKGLLFGSLVVLRLALGLIAVFLGLAIILFLPLFNDINRTTILLSLFLVLAIIIETSWEIIFQTFVRMDLKTIVDIFGTTVFLMSTIFLLKFGLKVAAPIIGWLLAKAIIILSLGLIGQKIINQKIKVKKEIILRLLKESLPMGTLLILSTAYDRAVDSLIIKHFFDSAQVGFYGLAYKIYSNLVLPAYFLVNTVFPTLSQNQKRKFWPVFKLSGLLLTLGLLLLVPLTIIFSQPIIVLIGSKEFFPSIAVLKILALALIFAYFNHLTGFSLIALDRQIDSLKIGLVAILWNLILNLIFVPQKGIIAAAWITVSTEALVFFISSLILIKRGS